MLPAITAILVLASVLNCVPASAVSIDAEIPDCQAIIQVNIDRVQNCICELQTGKPCGARWEGSA